MSYIEIIDCRTDEALITNEGVDMGSYAKNLMQFRLAKDLHGVDKDQAAFLVDLHDPDGDLVDTFCLDQAGFAALTGKPPESSLYYKQVDTEFWRRTREEYELQSAVQPSA